MSTKKHYQSFSPQRRALRRAWNRTQGISWQDYLNEAEQQKDQGMTKQYLWGEINIPPQVQKRLDSIDKNIGDGKPSAYQLLEDYLLDNSQQPEGAQALLNRMERAGTYLVITRIGRQDAAKCMRYTLRIENY